MGRPRISSLLALLLSDNFSFFGLNLLSKIVKARPVALSRAIDRFCLSGER
jgi:hypothetical protein